MEQEDFPPHDFKEEPIITLDKEQIISFIEFLSDKEFNELILNITNKMKELIDLAPFNLKDKNTHFFE